MVNGSRPPVKPEGCKSATARWTAATLAPCKSEARQARRRPQKPVAGREAWWRTPRPGRWREWQRRPGFLGPPWRTSPWSAKRWPQWSTPHRCQGRHWRHWSRWRCQWRRRHTGPGWQRLCWQMCLDEREKNNSAFFSVNSKMFKNVFSD